MAYSIYRLLQVQLVFLFLFTSHSVAATDVDKCYLEYAQEQASNQTTTLTGKQQNSSGSPLTVHLENCTELLNGEDLPGNIKSKISALTRTPNTKVSSRAAQVYYNNHTCGPDTKSGSVQCFHLGELSRTSPTGRYKFHINCSSVDQARCESLGPRIADSLGSVCDKSVAGRIYCDEFIHGALSNKLCSNSSGADACLTFVAKQQENGLCGMERFNKIDCFNMEEISGNPTGGVQEPLDATAGGPTDISTGSTSGTGSQLDPTGTNPTSNTSALEKLADDEAQRFFGAGAQGFGGQISNSPISGNTNVPDIQSDSSYSANQFDASGDFDNTRMATTTTQSGRSLISQLPPPNVGGPSRERKNQGNGPGGGSPQVGGGGGSSGAIGGTGGSGNGSRPRGRRGRRASRVTKASELSTNRFYGTTGGSGSSGGAPVLSKAIQKKIKQNQKNSDPGNNRGRINAALQSGLSKAPSYNPAFEKPIFNFPVEEAFRDLSRQESFVNEQGQLD